MDPDLKRSMEEVCAEMGLSMTTAFTIFAKKVSREHRIPFEVSADPFYSESNINHLLLDSIICVCNEKCKNFRYIING